VRTLAIVTMTSLAALFPPLAQAQQAPGAPSEVQAGPRIAQAHCAACHGPAGNSPNPNFPKLAGQDRAYLSQQLREYKTGARPSEVMAGIAARLSDREMADVASFYSRQVLKPEPVRFPVLQTEGRRIYFAERRAMSGACADCHDARTPGAKLNGQHAAYTVDQLLRFTRGDRKAVNMNHAVDLSEFEARAVAEFLASRP
jgi:cytochrome c553